MFAKRRSMAQQRYEQFVSEGIKVDSPWANLKGQVFLGDEQFVTRMQAHIQTGKDDVQIPLAQRHPSRRHWQKLRNMRQTEMPPLLRHTRQEDILTSKSQTTSACISRLREELFGEAADECGRKMRHR